MELQIDTIAGEFIMRNIETKDFESLYHLMEFNREILLDYFPITSKNTSTKALTKSYLRAKTAQMKEKKFFGFVAQPINEGQLISYIILKNLNWKVPKCEIAYMIDQEYAGTGLMTEFVEKTCSFAFEILNILKIYALASEQNPASRKVLLKCGFKEEGYLSHEYRSGSGKLENVYRFALLNEKMMDSSIQPKY